MGRVHHLFGKLVVLWCILAATLASAGGLWIVYRTGADASATLGTILGFFGGELLFLCLRAILKKREGPYDGSEAYSV